MNLKITNKNKIEGLKMLLINGSFETIYNDYSNELNITVPKGLYKLKLYVHSEYCETYHLEVDEDKDSLQ